MKTKILYMIDKLTLAGSQKHVCTLATNLDRDKFEPVICAVRSGGPLQERYEAQGIRVWVLGISKIYGFKALKSLLTLRAIIKQEQIDIVHCYQFNPTVFGVIAARLAGVKVILTARRDTGYWARAWHHFVYRILNSFTAKVLVNSLAVKEATIQHESLRPDKISLVYNGIDIEKYNKEFDRESIRQRYGILPNEKVIGMVAVIRPEKRYEDFIKACGIVAKKYKNVKFFVVGSGYPDLTDNLKQMCKDFGIEKRVIFTGRMDNIPEILSIFDIGCLTSKTEGFSNVILEYMAKGKPVIVTAVGGNKEVIQNGVNGMLIDAGDYKSLAKLIQRLLSDARFASGLGKEAQETIKNKFVIQKMVRNTSYIYEHLIAESKKRTIDKIKLRLKTHGIFFVIRKIIEPVLQIERLSFFEKKLDRVKSFYLEGDNKERLKNYAERLKKRYQFVVLSKENRDGYINDLSLLMQKDERFVQDWFNRGKYCFSFIKEGKIISYCWLTMGERCYEFMDESSKVPHEAFAHTAFTLYDYRGQGLASILVNEILIFSNKNNISRMHVFIAADNPRSIRSFISPLGFKLAKQKAIYLRIFNKEKYFLYS